MVMETLAAGGISMLTALLVKASKPLAEKAGQAVADAANSLLDAVKKKFKGDSYAEQTLNRLQEKPEAKDRQAALQGILTEQMEKDDAFAAEVKRLLEAARKADKSGVIASGERAVAIGGNASNNVIITGNNSQVKC